MTTTLDELTALQQSWTTWHRSREAELAHDHGWLTTVALHWLPAVPAAIGDLPGEFAAQDGGAWYDPAADGDWLLLTEAAPGGPAEPVSGPVTASIGEGESLLWLERGDVRLELLRRGGRVGVRVRDNQAPTRTGFRGVPAYSVDPDWVLTGTVRTHDPTPVTVDTAQPGLQQQVSTIGNLSIEIGGIAHELVLTGTPHRAVLVFHDPTNGADTAPWRLVAVEFTGNGAATVDFNHAVNLPFAFGPAGTCPAPVPGNEIAVPVTAGEQRPAAPAS